jgi:predicted acylesterase/phospholipase RssA
LDAALATLAAPLFFGPVTVGNRDFWDGGIIANNPIEVLYLEADRIWGLGRPSILKCIVSIGTGSISLRSKAESVEIRRLIQSYATTSENAAEQFLRNHRELREPDGSGKCFRFNVDQGLEGIGLDEVAKIPLIENASSNYLATFRESQSLELCGLNLSSKSGQSIYPQIVRLLY